MIDITPTWVILIISLETESFIVYIIRYETNKTLYYWLFSHSVV